MNNYCRKLNLPSEIETKDFPPKDYEDRVFMIRPPWSKISKNLHKFLDQLNLFVMHSEIFYTPPQQGIYIHVDTNKFSNMTKLNFCICNPFSMMNWFEIKKEYRDKNHLKQTMLTTNYLKYEPNEVETILHSECVAGWYIVNAGIPHNSTNFTNEQRWTLSYVLKDRETHDYLQFDKALEIFKNYIV
jgi:hypothetical protein